MDNNEFNIAKQYMKIGVGVIGVVAAIIVGKKIFTYIKERRAEAEREKAAKDALQQLKKSGLVSNLNEEEVKLIANQLFEAFNYTWGTDLDLFDLYFGKIKNAADWYAVKKAFGKQPYGSTGTPIWGSGEELDLIGWCNRELSGSRLQKCLEWENAVASTGLKGTQHNNNTTFQLL